MVIFPHNWRIKSSRPSQPVFILKGTVQCLRRRFIIKETMMANITLKFSSAVFHHFLSTPFSRNRLFNISNWLGLLQIIIQILLSPDFPENNTQEKNSRASSGRRRKFFRPSIFLSRQERWKCNISAFLRNYEKPTNRRPTN